MKPTITRITRTMLLFPALLLLLTGLCFAAPQAAITEEVTYTHLQDGTFSGTGIGYVEVGVGNTEDVLQNIVLNLTSTAKTNLQDARAYRGVAASPAWGRTRMLVNTTDDPKSITYTISDNSRPGVLLNITYGNYVGGQDLVPGRNVLWFNIALNPNADLDNVEFNLTIPNVTFPGAGGAVSVLNVSEPTASSSNRVGRSDLNLDGHYDYIYWTGDVTSGNIINIEFDGVIVPDTNFDEDDMYADLGEMHSYFEKDSTLTGIRINEQNKFARGPVQEGIEMSINEDATSTRGFIRNTATESLGIQGLVYRIDSWSLYPVDSLAALLQGSPKSYVNPGETVYTGWYAATGGKPYYRVAFDWQVLWIDSESKGRSTSLLSMPTVYEIDYSGAIASDAVSSDDAHAVLITNEVIHVGSGQIDAEGIYWNITLPCTGVGANMDWEVQSAKVYYSNTTNTSYRDQIGFASSTQDCLNGVGYARLELVNISTMLGKPLRLNDYLIFEINVTGNKSAADGTYSFNSTFLGITASGTHYSIQSGASEFLTGTGIVIDDDDGGDGGGGGGGGGGGISGAAAPAAESVVELSMDVAVDGRDALVDFSAEVKGTSAKVSNAYIELLVPTKSILVEDKLELIVRGEKVLLEPTQKTRKVDGENYNVYKYGTWMLERGDKVEFTYPISLGLGTNNIIAVLKGRNTETEKSITASISRVVRIALPPTQEGFGVWDGPFTITEAEVNKPVEWEKTFLAYNNQSTRKGQFKALVFPDTLDVEVVDMDNEIMVGTLIKEGGQFYISWEDTLEKFETISYVVRAYTPPVIGMITTLDVINTSKELTYFELNFSLESLALEDYQNISYFLPLEIGVVESVEVGKSLLNYTYNPFKILIPEYGAEELQTGRIIYKERPPQLLVLSDRDQYSLGSKIDVTAVIITKDPIEGAYAEFEIIGPAPDYDTIFYDTMKIGDLEGASINRIPYPLSLTTIAGTHTIRVKLRKNLWTILDGQKEIEMSGVGLARDLFIILVLFAILITFGFSVYRIRKLSSRKTGTASIVGDKCIECGTGFTDKRKYRCERCHKPVCFEHVEFYKGHLYCKGCSKLEKVDNP